MCFYRVLCAVVSVLLSFASSLVSALNSTAHSLRTFRCASLKSSDDIHPFFFFPPGLEETSRCTSILLEILSIDFYPIIFSDVLETGEESRII